MTDYPFYQIDAFATKAFEGIQACVMLMDAFLSDEALLAIAAENNVSETAYIVPTGEDSWDLRWFTPAVEVPLCGHATLAAAHVLFDETGFSGSAIKFDTRQSGRLSVRKTPDAKLEMDFPSAPIQKVEVTDDIAAVFGARPVEAWGGMFYAARFESVEDVRALSPDLRVLASLGVLGDGWDRGNFGCFAAGGDRVDVTSRFFAPGSGIDEDPATGSWHTMLARVMNERFGLDTMNCFQAYPGRGAHIQTRLEGERVYLTGQAVTVIKGQFAL